MSGFGLAFPKTSGEASLLLMFLLWVIFMLKDEVPHTSLHLDLSCFHLAHTFPTCFRETLHVYLQSLAGVGCFSLPT